MTHTVDIQQVESRLSELLSAVLAGDEVVFTQEEKPVARLIPITEKKLGFPLSIEAP